MQRLQELASSAAAREAGLHAQLAAAVTENLELRRAAARAMQAPEPNVVQLKQALLDPAVAREVTRLRSELEEAQRQVRKLSEDLAGASYSQETNIGRMLVAKCRALAQENEELGEALAEGRQSELAAQLAVQRGANEVLLKAARELADTCSALSADNEELQMELMLARRQVLAAAGQQQGGGVGGSSSGGSGGCGGAGGGTPTNHQQQQQQQGAAGGSGTSSQQQGRSGSGGGGSSQQHGRGGGGRQGRGGRGGR